MEIQDFPNYLIYQDGRVFSKKRNRFLKSTNLRGYFRIQIVNSEGKPKSLFIHRLIGIHYIPNPNNLPFIDHKDRNRQNNNIDNLRWCNHSQNMQNKGNNKNNTSGIKNIGFFEKEKFWKYEKVVNGVLYQKKSKNKQLVLWVKFVHSLKLL